MRYLVLSLLVLAVTTVYGQDKSYRPVADPAVVEKKIMDNSLKVSSITSDFVQEKKMEYLDEVLVSKGKFWYKHESKLRWQYDEPYEYIIAIRNGSFYIKDDVKVKVYDVAGNPAFREMNDLILKIARGTLAGDKRFEIEMYENDRFYLLRLRPIDAALKGFLQTTEIYLSKSDLSAEKVVMHETETDYTQITFINRKLNNEIPESIFDIK